MDRGWIAWVGQRMNQQARAVRGEEPISARSAAELFSSSAPVVRRFQRMYEAADVTPEQVATISTTLD